MIGFIITLILQVVVAYLIGTVIFDFIHYSFHASLNSKYKILRTMGSLHMVHHRFFSSKLKINNQYSIQNLKYHVLIEYLIHMGSILTCLLFLEPWAILIAAIFETSIFILVCSSRGMDVRHRPYNTLPSYRGWIFVSSHYHALHHLYPNKFFSSCIKLIDYLFGTAIQLKGKRLAMTGANGALGQNMRRLLAKEGTQITNFKFGVDYTYDNYQKLAETLAKTDILLLCHGSKNGNAQQANCDSFVEIIELFKKVRKRDLAPVEIWGVGSEIECHPCFGIKTLHAYADSKRNYARKARAYFHDRDIQYRHIVHSAFTSRMGPGLMTANFAAKVTLFLIKRGFRYVPVTYTGFAFINYFRFVLQR